MKFKILTERINMEIGLLINFGAGSLQFAVPTPQAILFCFLLQIFPVLNFDCLRMDQRETLSNIL